MSSPVNDDFDIISHKSSSGIYHDWEKHSSGITVDTDVQIHAWLREHYPELTITTIPASNLPLVAFANAGYATAELDTKTDSILRWRGFIPPARRGEKGRLGDAIMFAKYHYVWLQEDFILYTIGSGYSQMQYILKEPGPDEDLLSNNAKCDALIKTAVEMLGGNANEYVYVYDGYWSRSKELWDEVMKSSWDKVILDPKMKQNLQDISSSFFDSKELYDRYGVPWKRGLIFAGPPGNGKTISIKALMKTLYQRKEPIPTLYVKNAPGAGNLAAVFRQARLMTPCLLVMEDIETIVTPVTRSYFFNEVDGLNNNGGLLMVASTNYLDRLDPGLSKRPSRFDRKFIFPMPDEYERTLYCQFWRKKLEDSKSDVPFPEKLCPEMAKITDGFSFAYLQEAFVATLLTIAREAMGKEFADPMEAPTSSCWSIHSDTKVDEDEDDDDLDSCKLWRVFKEEVASLRQDMGSGKSQFNSNSFSPLAVHNPTIPPPSQSLPGSFPATTNIQAAVPQPSWMTGLPIRPAATAEDLHTSKFNTRSTTEFETGAGPGLTPTVGTHAGKEPTTQELSNAGFMKRLYFAQSAYEWKH